MFLSTESSKDLWDLASFIHSFLWLTNNPLYGGIPHFSFLSNDEFLKFFHCLAIMNIAVNSHVHICVCVCVHLFSTLEYLPRSGIARPKMSLFHFPLVIWSKPIRRYKIGNWETEYCSQLHVEELSRLFSFLTFGEEGLRLRDHPSCPPEGTHSLAPGSCRHQSHLEWVPVLPAFLLFSPQCLLPSTLGLCPHLQPGWSLHFFLRF